MKASYTWLKDYVDFNLTPSELDNLLTFGGLEIEGVDEVQAIKGGLEHVVIAKVLTCEPHPNSDHLHVTTVDVGGDRPLDIVCGAPNVAAGQKVVCATIGTKIYTSDEEFYEIKKGKLRGATSEGMLCAADELHLGTSHDGIMVLPDDAVVGTPARDYFGLQSDYVLEVAITANRSDATSHIGVARDIVAVLNTRDHSNLSLRWPEALPLPLGNADEKNPITVEVLDTERCPRYSGISIQGVTVAESPKWLRDRLSIVGIRPINNIVDITNYVLMEVGQPMHAFDADKIDGNKVVVRTMPQGTKFVTLDGVERSLDERDLMICNANEGMCIAGVFGGLKSGVTMETKNIFLESAYFNPVSIRKTSKRHTLKTDASFRYERGCDPNITVWAIRRAAYLIQQLAGGKIVGTLIDNYPTPIEPAVVDIDFQRVHDLVGATIPVDAMRTALTSLNIEIVEETEKGMRLRIPTCKVDVYRECDVVEEIMRIYGYNNIQVDEKLNSCLAFGKKPNPRKLQNLVSEHLTATGFNEIMNNSLTRSAYYEQNPDFPFEGCVQIINPLSKELNVMRRTLLYSGLECVARNINYKFHDQMLYEFGRSYDLLSQEDVPVVKKFAETQHLSLFLTGNQSSESWMGKPLPVDFYYLKRLVMHILHQMRVNEGRVTAQPATVQYLSEGLQLVYRDSHKVFATFGQVSNAVLKQMDIKQPVFYADIDWDQLLQHYPTKEVSFAEMPKFPEVRRDLALILDKSVTFEQIEQVARNSEKKILKHVGLFDIYEGKGIEDGKKSYAVSFVLQDVEKTLNDKQIETTMAKIQKNLEGQLGAKVRS